jgi:hypothetical protein
MLGDDQMVVQLKRQKEYLGPPCYECRELQLMLNEVGPLSLGYSEVIVQQKIVLGELVLDTNVMSHSGAFVRSPIKN